VVDKILLILQTIALIDLRDTDPTNLHTHTQTDGYKTHKNNKNRYIKSIERSAELSESILWYDMM
jgi:hypothetical protein